jgi:hypothetical protein
MRARARVVLPAPRPPSGARVAPAQQAATARPGGRSRPHPQGELHVGGFAWRPAGKLAQGRPSGIDTAFGNSGPPAPMAKIKYVEFDGREHEVEVKPG